MRVFYFICFFGLLFISCDTRIGTHEPSSPLVDDLIRDSLQRLLYSDRDLNENKRIGLISEIYSIDVSVLTSLVSDYQFYNWGSYAMLTDDFTYCSADDILDLLSYAYDLSPDVLESIFQDYNFSLFLNTSF